jgi:hypothetical protein
MKTISILLSFCILLLFSCKKQEEDVQVKITFYNSPDKTPFNRNYTIDQTRLYLSNFQLIDVSGNIVNIKDLILVKSGNDNSFTFNLPSGTFSSFKYSFGLDKTTNNLDPSNYEASHPLSTEQDMFWGMLKYRFIVIEGKIDSSIAKNKTPEQPFSMHLGTDTLYREITTNIVDNKLKRGSVVSININLNKIFVLDTETFNLNNFSNHSDESQIPRAITIVDTLVSGIKTSIFSPN